METVIRVTIAYIIVWAAFRVLGKRELTRTSPLELVMLLFIPQLFSRALTRQDYSLTNAVIGVTTLLSLVFLSSSLTYRFAPIARVMISRPTVLVEHGRFIDEALDHERLSANNIFDAMHKVGLYRLDEVLWAVLQSDGKIAVIPGPDARPALLNPAATQREPGL